MYSLLVQTWEITEDINSRQEYLAESGHKVYCLMTKSGWECELARHLNLLNSNILALPFVKYIHTSRNGIKGEEQRILLPSYVFLYSREDYQIETLNRICPEGFSYVYSANSPDRTLLGNDRKYAEWVFSSRGIIGMSKAIRIGSRVKIVDGPLLGVEGMIKEYSKKNRNCRVEATLFNQIISVWLPFVYVDEVKEN